MVISPGICSFVSEEALLISDLQDLTSDLLDLAEGSEWPRLLSLLLAPTHDSEVAQLQSNLTSGLSVALLLSASEGDLATLNKNYKEAGDTELMADLAAASEFGQVLSDQLRGKKEQSFAVNDEAVRKDADILDQVRLLLKFSNPYAFEIVHSSLT